MPVDVFRRFDSYRGMEPLGPMWTVTKNGRTAACSLATHVLGWELRILLDGELIRSEVCKTEPGVFDTSDGWRRDCEAKGWAR
jgi:hypothetical protein